jgi:nitrogen fixation protein NifB
MKMISESHPCYNPSAAANHSRIHLPIAPSCNIQCKFCNRAYDCPNESRPGVTSAILSPHQAVYYLEKATEQNGPFAVVGIAGPGDPFSEADLTIETFELIRKKYPDITLCVASNGLNIGPYIKKLADLNVKHVTITVNAITAEVGAQIVSWVRFERRIYRGVAGAEILLKNQMEAIKSLHEHGIMVKVNTVVIPGVNDTQIEEIAKKVAGFGADVINCIPVIPVEGCEFENVAKPDHELMQTVRWNASQHLTLVRHCARCRADAVGLLGKENGASANDLLKQIASGPLYPGENRPNVAVATREGLLVNEHLGRSKYFYVYGQSSDGFNLIERREAPPEGSGFQRWTELSKKLHDCKVLLVNQSGEVPKAVLSDEGIRVIDTEGLISEALTAVYTGHNPVPVVAAKSCSGKAGGCC